MRRLRPHIGAILVMALVLAACDGAREEPREEAPTKAQYVRQANQICERYSGEFMRLFETDFPVLRSQLPAFFEKAAPIWRTEMRELRELRAPEGDREEVEEILDSGDKVVADIEAGVRDERKALEVFGAEGGPNARDFEQKAGAYGLRECAQLEVEEEQARKLDPATFSPAKRAYVERADGICRRADERTDPIEDEAFREFPPTLERWARVIPRLLPIERQSLQELRQLEPPAEDRERVEAILQKRTDLFNTIEQGAQAAAARDEARFTQVMRPVFQRFEETDGELREYGFQVCGSEDVEGPGTSPSPGAASPGAAATTPTATPTGGGAASPSPTATYP